MSSNAFQNKSIALPVAHALKVAGVCKIHSRLCPRELRGVSEKVTFLGLQYTQRKLSCSGDQLNGCLLVGILCLRDPNGFWN